MTKLFSFFLALSLAAAAPASALEWQAVGPRALGMGGAGVALSQGPVASYWNPAALGRETENAYGLAVPIGVHAGLTGDILAGAKDLKNANDNCSSLGPVACQAQINAALAELGEPGNGLRVDANTGADLKIGKLALFLDGYLDAGAVPKIDFTNTTAGTIQSNQSALIVKGARILEAGVGYGHELPFAPGLFLGGDVKLMNAQVGYTDYLILQNDNDTGDIATSLKDDAKTSSNFGVDAGALWDVNRTWDAVPLHPRFGIVGRNLNNPKFSQPDSAVKAGFQDKFAVNGQVRAGASISPFHWWNIATDLDLTRNLTPVDNVASRQWGLGTEINVFNRSWINIPVRVGLSRNLAMAGSGTNFTAGTGINLLHLIIDVSGSVNNKRVNTQTQGESKKFPTEAAAAFSLSLLFGGAESSANARDDQPVPVQNATSAKDLPQSQADKVKADADKAQKDLDKQSGK